MDTVSTGDETPAPAERPAAASFLLRSARELGLFVLCIVGTLFLTYPAIDAIRLPALHGYHIQDAFHDVQVIHWDLWWMKHAVVDLGENPFRSAALYHPTGVDLFYTPFVPFFGLASIPLQAMVSPPAAPSFATNVLTLLAYALGVYCMMVLIRSLGISALPALLAAFAFSFAPFRIMHFPRLHYLSGFWLPIHALLLLRYLRHGGWGSLLGTAIVGLCTLLSDHHHFLFIALTAVAIVIAQFFNWGSGFKAGKGVERQTILKRAAFGALLQTVVLAPLFLTAGRPHDDVGVTERLYFERTETARPAGDHLLVAPNLDNLAYILSPAIYEMFADAPRPAESLAAERQPYRRLWRTLHDQGVPSGIGHALFAAMLLAAFGWGVARGRVAYKWVWIGLTVFAFVLALGPTRMVGDTPVPMPFRWFAVLIPPLKISRYPAAFIILGLFASAPVVAAGLHAITRCCSLGRLYLVATCGLAAFIAWSALGAEGRLAFKKPVETPAYALLALAPDPGAIVELPLGDLVLQRLTMIGQIQHGRAMAEGAITRVDKVARRFLESNPLLKLVRDPPEAPRDYDAGERAALLGGLSSAGFRYLLVHRLYYAFRPAGQLDRTLALLRALKAQEVRVGDVHVFELEP